jgi:hypothetical protein
MLELAQVLKSAEHLKGFAKARLVSQQGHATLSHAIHSFTLVWIQDV